MRTDLGEGHSKLHPPAVVNAAATGDGGFYDGPGVRLVFPSHTQNTITRRATHYVLRPPRVVNPAQTDIFVGPKVTLSVGFATKRRSRVGRRNPDYELRPPAIGADRIYFGPVVHSVAAPVRRIRQRTTYALGGPVVIYANTVYFGPKVQLAPFKRSRLKFQARLAPPVVVASAGVFFGPKVVLNVHLPEQRRIRVSKRSPEYELKPPAVVGDGIVYRPLQVELTYSVRGKPKSLLKKPTDTVGLEDQGRVDTTLVAPYQRAYRIPRAPHSRLFPPAVVGDGVVYRPTQIHLAYSRRGVPKSILRKPTDTVGLEDQGRIKVWLVTNAFQLRFLIPRAPHSKLFPPSVVGAGVVYRPILLRLTYSRRGVPKSRLNAPTVVGAGIAYFGPAVLLIRITPPPTMSRLQPPAVVTQVEVVLYFGPQVNLVLGRRPVAKPFLSPPAHVQVDPNRPVAIHLTYSRRGVAKPFLAPPAHIQVDPNRPVAIHLTYSRRGTPKPFLAPPAHVQVDPNRALQINLAPSFRGKAKPQLAPPAHVQVDPNRPLQIHLTYSRRGVPKSHLFAPTDTTGLEDQGKVAINLAPSARGRTTYSLFPPELVGVGVVYRPLQVKLTYSRRGTPKSAIFPGLVGRDVYFGPKTHLTYSRRGKPKYFLRGPQVVNRPLARAIQIFLAPQARGVPQYFLRPAIIPPLAEPIRITLRPQRRGVPKSTLHAPIVVRLAVEIYGPEIQLAYSRRGRPQYRLEPPVVVGRQIFYGPTITLTYSRRGVAKSRLAGPEVVRVFTAEPIRTQLTRIKPSPTLALLRPAVVVGQRPFRPIQTTLAQIEPAPTVALLKPPSVVGAGVAYFGPEIHITRIKPPKVIFIQFRALVVESPFVPPRGHVCGFDIAGSFICFVELPGTKVSGSDRAGSNVYGTTGTTGRVSGGDNAGGSVSGGDRAAE